MILINISKIGTPNAYFFYIKIHIIYLRNGKMIKVKYFSVDHKTPFFFKKSKSCRI